MSSPAIDKEQFNKTIPLVALKIPAKQCNEYLGAFKDHVFMRPKMKRIHTIEGDNEHRLLLLAESISDIDSLPEALKQFNELHKGEPQPYQINITYDQLGVEEVLRRILPESVTEIPSAFEQAGHLAHVNLREDCLPFKHIIGQVLLDKNPGLKTVVNKVGNIETEFRTFPMELLAGENNFNVLLKESGATFNFNFADVYWNSRLQMEHSRIINWIAGIEDGAATASGGGDGSKSMRATVNANVKNARKQKAQNAAAAAAAGSASADGGATPKAAPLAPKFRTDVVVADMMAGVGPFAIPLSMGHVSERYNITVHANDLNPASYKYLCLNGRTNHCGNRLVPYNMDGRDFIISLLDKNTPFQEVLMNLPQNATDFLDVFIGMGTRLGDRFESSKWTLPRIHVYAFSTAMDDPAADIAHRAAGVLRCDPALLHYYPKGVAVPDGVEACVGHVVRDVSPKKVMVCLSFRLPREVAFAEPVVVATKKRSASEGGDNDEEKPDAKVAKV